MEIGPYIGAADRPMTRRILNITIYDDLLSVEEAKVIERTIKEYLQIEEEQYYQWTLRQDVAPDSIGA